MTIDVYDNVLPEIDSQLIDNIMSDREFYWQYYHKSNGKEEIYHWHRLAGRTKVEIEKNGFEWLLPFWDHLMNKYDLEEKYGVEQFRRIYFNAHTHGLEPRKHRDDGDYTMIYYPLLSWRKEWGGGTTIWNEDTSDVEKHVAYIGNRLIIFPARRLHQAQPIHKDCYKLRSVIVFKCWKDDPSDERLDFYKD